jgi:alkanesulfonate monooxygenase SsuD/methylene tetrahydromethanopterin reductase-like flavin-dependent oxidoreductase (luciferase family)
MKVCMMVEGQESVTWEQWVALARACELFGLAGLFRSDHYLSVEDPPFGIYADDTRSSLDAWCTLSALAAVTERITLGTLVSPATFRHPSVLAKSFVTADEISGGRVEVALGAGWWEREHAAYGFDFPPLRTRMEILGEQLEIVRRSWGEEPFSFAGEHYRTAELDARPKPGRPWLIVGGEAGPKGSALAARWADEYNVNLVDLDECSRRRARIVAAWDAAGRDPASVRFSLMTGALVAGDRQTLRARAAELARLWRREIDAEDLIAELSSSWFVGTPDEVIPKLRQYAELGVDRVMLQHHLHWDLDSIELIGNEVVPAVADA